MGQRINVWINTEKNYKHLRSDIMGNRNKIVFLALNKNEFHHIYQEKIDEMLLRKDFLSINDIEAMDRMIDYLEKKNILRYSQGYKNE